MYIRVKGIILSGSLLIGAIILTIGYGFLGNFLYNAYRRSDLLVASVILVIALASIWALPKNLGGIFAAIAMLTMAYVNLGFGTGLLATAICIAIFWLGLIDADYSVTQAPKIMWWEWIAIAINLSLSLILGLVILQNFSGNMGGIVLGILAGTVVVLAAQIKSAELAKKQALVFSSWIVLTGLIAGAIHAASTYTFVRQF